MLKSPLNFNKKSQTIREKTNNKIDLVFSFWPIQWNENKRTRFLLHASTLEHGKETKWPRLLKLQGIISDIDKVDKTVLSIGELQNGILNSPDPKDEKKKKEELKILNGK